MSTKKTLQAPHDSLEPKKRTKQPKEDAQNLDEKKQTSMWMNNQCEFQSIWTWNIYSKEIVYFMSSHFEPI